MSVADRIDPKEHEDLESFLLAHEIKNIALKKLIAFTRKAAKHSCCACASECCIACDAVDLLREFGEA